MSGPTGAVRTKIELQGEREYDASIRRAQAAAERAAQATVQGEQRVGRETGREYQRLRRAAEGELKRIQAEQSRTAVGARALTSAIRTAGAALTGMQAGIAIVLRVVAALEKAGEAAQEYRRVVDGHAVSVAAADQATAGLIDTIELHRQAARLEQAGLRITSDQYRAMSVAATQYARATGTDVTQAHQRLTQAVITGGRGMREFGVEVEQTGTIQERQQRVVEELTRRHSDQTIEIETTQEAMYALRNAWGTAWAEMQMTVEQSGGFIMRTLQRITGFLNDVSGALETQRRSAAGLEVSRLLDQQIAAQREQSALAERLRSRGIDPDALAAPGQVPAEQLDRPDPAMMDILEGRRHVSFVAREDLDLMNSYTAATVRLAEAEEAIRVAEGRRDAQRQPAAPADEEQGAPDRAGRGRRAAAIDEAAEAERRLLAVLGDVLGAVEDQEGARRANLEVSEAAAEAERAHIGLLQTQQQKRIELAEQEAAARQAAADARQAEIEAEREATAARIQMIEQVLQATQQAGQITQGIFGSVQTIIAQTGKSAEEQAKAEGRFLVAYSVVQAIIEGARAIAAFASQRYASGAMHVLSAAAFGVAAAAAGSKLGGGGGAVAVAPPPRPAPEPQDRRTDSGGQTVIHNYSLGRTNAEAGHSIRRLEWEADRRGSGRSGTPGVGYS
jgi:hypothetical protein